MGEAKRRGTFDERKAAAVVKERKTCEVKAHIAQRRPSPKLVATMGLLAAMMQAPNSAVEARRKQRRNTVKTIVVKWVEEKVFGYGKAMVVIESDHERFCKGSRFDYGFFNIATDEGYTIVSLPMDVVPNMEVSGRPHLGTIKEN